MLKAYKYYLQPSQEQKTLINKHLGSCRWLYNYALNKKIISYQTDKTQISRFDLQKELPELKKQTNTEWLAEINSQSLQAVLRNLDMAYTRFFRQKKGSCQNARVNSTKNRVIKNQKTLSCSFNLNRKNN